MSEYVVKLPDVGEGIAEAEIVEWHVNVGDTIAEDQVMVEVMTDKATVELPSPVAGVVTSVGAAVGEILQVGSPLIRIDTGNGVTVEVPPAAEPADSPPAQAPPAPVAAAPGPPEESAEALAAEAPATERTTAPTAAPAVRQRAATLGIDLAGITPTGPDGRVTHADVDAQLSRARATAGKASPITDDVVDAVPVVGLRRNIAQRMQIAKERIPHFTYVEEVDVTDVERLRAKLNEQQSDDAAKLTVLPFLMRAVVVAVRDFPQVNARYDDENGVVNRHRSVHLGIAAQTPKGLMVPVVMNADARDLWDSAAEVARLATAARTNKVTLEELTGSTITITSLGSLGGIVSTPIINYPEVAIVGVNKIATRPVYVDGVLLPRQIMNLSSSFDHRVVDGADAAAFIQRIKTLLESPALLFIN
ncbi:MAG TPA: dihydrolipoamide acetyltransferase family protein [Ilumatobacteraceae bacterium]|nr:dihydrolipoamide acetyltransferase family protein [Ilumatobacteraceae bacterium]